MNIIRRSDCPVPPRVHTSLSLSPRVVYVWRINYRRRKEGEESLGAQSVQYSTAVAVQVRLDTIKSLSVTFHQLFIITPNKELILDLILRMAFSIGGFHNRLYCALHGPLLILFLLLLLYNFRRYVSSCASLSTRFSVHKSCIMSQWRGAASRGLHKATTRSY